MGKRKRVADQKETPLLTDAMPYHSTTDSPWKEKSSHSVDNSTPNTHYSEQNLSRVVVLKHPHRYGCQYSRRNSTNKSNLSTPQGKGIADDEKLSSKFASQVKSNSGLNTGSNCRHYSRRNSTNKSILSPSQAKGISNDDDLSSKFSTQLKSDSGIHTETIERSSCEPERTRIGSPAHVVSSVAAKMVCGICEKLLRRKPIVFENTLPLANLSVVAVLVCGHVYHADCLEQRTGDEDLWDPLCPLCVDQGA